MAIQTTYEYRIQYLIFFTRNRKTERKSRFNAVRTQHEPLNTAYYNKRAEFLFGESGPRCVPLGRVSRGIDRQRSLLYLGGLVDASADIMPETKRRVRLAWTYYSRSKRELDDMEAAPFVLKVRMLKAEVMGTLLYGCVT